MSRRAKRQSEGSLDSLLDTMTNVVGILVILLTMTQINVSDAIRHVLRMRADMAESENVTPAQLAAAIKERDDLKEKLELTRATLADLSPTAVDAAAQITIEQQKVDALKKEAELAARAKTDAEAAKKALEAQKNQLAKAEDDTKNLDAEMSKLAAQLDKTPKRVALKAKVVNLPNPRPAPKGLEPMYFICQGDRVVPVPLDGIQKLVDARLRGIVSKTNDKGEVDCDAMVALFEKTDIGTSALRVKILVANYRPFMVISPREGAGESTEQIRDGQSKYRVQVFRADPKTHYAQFLVWPDSLEAYVEARRICDERGILAGWIPFYDKQEWRTNLSKILTCEGKPPPPPPPPVTTPAPPPTTPAPPPRKALPPDTVD